MNVVELLNCKHYYNNKYKYLLLLVCYAITPQSAYGGFALFFHELYGGEVIAVLWKPVIKEDREFQGPFKTSIMSIKDCSNPSKPYVKNPPVVFLPITHNSSLSGNITFLKDTKNVKIRLRGFILHNGKWESSYLINNLDCHGMVLHFMCVTLNIKYDRKKCLYLKGSYSFENVDVNQLLHFWISKVKYGHILWRSETYTQAGTYNCKEFDTMTEPA